MKKLLFLCLMSLSLTMSAQYDPCMVPTWCGDKSPSEAMVGQLSRDIKSRNSQRQVLPVKKWLLSDVNYWTNGFFLFYTSYDPEYKSVELHPEGGPAPERWVDPIKPLEYKGGKVQKEGDRSSSYSVERLGSYVMLVERNTQGQPVSAYYHVSDDDRNHNAWVLWAQQVFTGNYTTSKGDHAVFGPKLPFYTGESWHTDPGVWETFRLDDDAASVIMLYGSQRVSRGNPNHPNYKANVPGGGGAGALMGPMAWKLTPTKGGLHVQVVRDEPYVDHNPEVESGSELILEQSAYEGIPGKWAFASVVPLTHQILSIFPKEVLTLMRGEIYARHGDTFKDAATQRYFDAQPWYKKGKGSVALTDIERFNYALIKQVEMTK